MAKIDELLGVCEECGEAIYDGDAFRPTDDGDGINCLDCAIDLQDDD